MKDDSIGLRSLALSFPDCIRTNDDLGKTVSELAIPARVRQPRKQKATAGDTGLEIWSQEVAPYLDDPFRGSVERRTIAQGESLRQLELRAARQALEAANLKVEAAIVSSLFSESVGAGDAASLVWDLGLRCPAWNLESTCSSALVALQNARALVKSGEYRTVLVVVSQWGSRTVDAADTLSVSMGDGAGAFVVSTVRGDRGILGTQLVSTAETAGSYSHELVTDPRGVPRIRTRTGDASLLAETAVDFVRTCCQGAADAAGVRLDRIDFFAFNTPTAWYASVCARALGIDPQRTLNLYPRYANIGPVFPIANLDRAVRLGKLRDGDLVLVYSNGAGATAGATVMRWGEVALGEEPAPPIAVAPEREQVCFARTESAIANDRALLPAKLLAAPPETRQQLLETYLIGWLAPALQLSPKQLVPQQPLAPLLDSLLALTFKSQIELDLQVRVPMETFLGETTIAHLAKHLLDRWALVDLMAADRTSVEEERETLRI